MDPPINLLFSVYFRKGGHMEIDEVSLYDEMHVDIVGGGWWVCHNSVCVVSGYYVVVSHPALCYTRAHTGSTLGLVVASCPGFWVSQLLQCHAMPTGILVP